MRIGLLRSKKTKFGPRLLRMATTMTTMTMTKTNTMTMMTMVTTMTEAWSDSDVLQRGRGPDLATDGDAYDMRLGLGPTVHDDDDEDDADNDRGVARR